jgi:Tfp pilus assembly protein PilO
MNTENKTLKTYKYALILGASTLVGTVAVYFLIVSPLYKKMEQAGLELTAKEETYEGLVAKKAKLDGLKDKEAELKKQAEMVSNALPKEEEIGRMFIQLDALAKSSNGVLRSVSKSNAGAVAESSADIASAGITKTIYSLPLTLPTYYDLKTFIADSRSALRLFSINDFNISASDAGAMTVSLTANSYTRK